MPPFRVGKPRAQLVLDDEVEIPTGIAYDVEWDQALNEDPANWDPGDPSLYPVLLTGLWSFTSQLFLLVYEPTLVLVQVTTETKLLLTVWAPPPVVSRVVIHFSWLGQLDAGEHLKVTITNGTTISMYLEGGQESFLNVTRIGPERWT